MVIIWGEKVTRKPLGRIAEVCPICRCPAACDVASVTKVSHLYYIPIGSGTPIAQELTCTNCKTVWGLDPGTFTGIERDSRARSIEELLAACSHDRVLAITDRLAALEEIPADADSDARAGALLEGLRAIEYHYEQTKHNENAASVLVMTVVVLLVIAAPFVWFAYLDRTSRMSILWPIGCTAALLASLIAAVWLNGRWFKRRRDRQVRRLALSVAPLNPSPRELDWLLAVASKRRIEFVKGLSCQELTRAVAECRAGL